MARSSIEPTATKPSRQGAAPGSEAGPLGAAETLGVPALPPARVARFGDRVRAAVGRTHDAMGLPPVRVMEAALAPLDLAVVAALCRLDVPDRLDRRRSVTDLAGDLGVDASRFDRLVRFAAARGVLRLDRAGRVRPTRTLRFLRRDHPGGWRAWIEFAAGAEVTAALGSLDQGLVSDGDAFAAANDAPFFAWMAQHPDRHATFDRAMAAGARMHGVLLADAVDWSTSRQVCDVGGGDGTLLGTVLAHHGHLQGTVVELAEVVARAPDHDRVTMVAGDAFTEVPSGADTYLLVNVLHDWSDADAARLLQVVVAALREGRPDADVPRRDRVLVVESLPASRPRDGIALRADLLMLALTPGGRERSAQEFAALGAAAGLRLRRTTPLASGDAVHEFVLA